MFKAFFNRTRDWADPEKILAAETIDPNAVAAVLIRFPGGDDERFARLLGATVR